MFPENKTAAVFVYYAHIFLTISLILCYTVEKE